MNDWKKALLKDSATMRDAIEAIDKGSLQIVVIVDDENRLVGTVTDGDIRRGILKGLAFTVPVPQIMRAKPRSATVHQTREEILALMKQKKIHQIPVLDDDGRVVGIEVLDELLAPPSKENWVVLMAGGLGTRLRPLTDAVPKPMIPIGQKPILESILESFIECGFRNFFISVHYKDHVIRNYFADGSRWGVNIRYLAEDERLGTAGALSLLPEKPSAPMFIMNGDLLTKVNFNQLLSFHAEHKLAATMCVREYDFQVPYGVLSLDGHKIVNIDEKPTQKFFVNAGIYVLEPKAVDLIPKGRFYDMPQLFNDLKSKGQATAAFPIREYWIDIGHLRDLIRANGDLAGGTEC